MLCFYFTFWGGGFLILFLGGGGGGGVAMPDVSQYAIQINQSEVQFDSISGGDLPPGSAQSSHPQSRPLTARERERERKGE